MNIWHDIDEKRIQKDDFVCVIEISQGSKNKYELDKETGMLILDRVLHAAMVYPTNYGFIPKTYGGDKDPLDVLVICVEPIVPLTLVRCRPIGIVYMLDGGEADEKIIAISAKDPHNNKITDVNELKSFILDEIKHFFTFYKKLENKETQVTGVGNCLEAQKVIGEAINNYKSMFCN
ncbi:MAG: inorganic diphosphatase [Oscillospiraceae bacterium]|jgi:inorganic pyrophosphatase|nr:inorganic diphosphatase [Oscillospiraceae bacterium]